MKIFVDTSAWFALHDRDDKHHKASLIKADEIKKRKINLYTSDYIIDETITLIRFKVSHQSAIILGNSLLSSNIVTIVDVSQDMRLKAWELFKRYSDKTYSFTDCTSFVIMKDLAIKKAFTFDEHFIQAGFEIF